MGVITSFVGSLITVGFGYAQFMPVSTLQPDKFEASALTGASLGAMIGSGSFLQLAIMFVLMPVVYWLPRWRWAQPILMVITPLPFLAAILGWLVRETGRQPWLIVRQADRRRRHVPRAHLRDDHHLADRFRRRARPARRRRLRPDRPYRPARPAAVTLGADGPADSTERAHALAT